MKAKQFLANKGVHSLETQKRYNEVIAWMEEYAALRKQPISGSLPLTKEHQCFERGHTFYLVCEIDNGRSKYGEHKCSRCGHDEHFQHDYGSF